MKTTINFRHALTSGKILAIVALFSASFTPAVSAQEGSNALEAIEVATLPGDLVQLRFRMSEAAPQPVSFTIDNPARIALDLPDTHIAMDKRRTEVSVGYVRNVMTAEAQGKTRVVINLSSLIKYDTRVQGNSIFVTLGQSEAGEFGPASRSAAAAPAKANSMPAPATKAQPPREKAIESIDFRRGETGEGRVVVKLSDPKTVVDLKQEGDRIIAEFKNVQLADSMIQRYDVLDFATPVKTIDATRHGRDARLVVSATGDFEQLAYQTNELFTLELKPIVDDEEEQARREKEYEGERITLNFQDIEVRAVLQIIADISGLNVVVSDAVTGNLTLRLENVPWDQALDIVLRTKGLAMRQNGNVILVAPATEIAEMERVELESRQQIEELEPLRSEFIQANYAKAADLAALIKGDEATLLSERGFVSVDERTNTLLVQDTESRLVDIRRLVTTLDVPVRQVLIESRVVVANDNFNRELGARLGYSQYYFGDDGRRYTTSGNRNANADLNNSVTDALLGGSQSVEFPGEGLNVDLPVANAAGSFALAILGSGYLVDLELSALQAEGKGEVVSAPRVVTADQKEATIKQGVQLPYLQAAASGATNVAFIDAVLKLVVRPQITPDNRIIMDLQVHKDAIGQEVSSGLGGRVPAIDTRQISTQVLVNNGDTVVLGGVYETTRNTSVTKVPLLGDIPGVGFLFRTNSEDTEKRELLIFVTPKILDDRLITE